MYLIKYIGQLVLPDNDYKASPSREVDLTGDIYDFLYTNWVAGRYYTEDRDRLGGHYHLDQFGSSNKLDRSFFLNENVKIRLKPTTHTLINGEKVELPVKEEKDEYAEFYNLVKALIDKDRSDMDEEELEDLANLLERLIQTKVDLHYFGDLNKVLLDVHKRIFKIRKLKIIKNADEELNDILTDYYKLLKHKFPRGRFRSNSDSISRIAIGEMSVLYICIEKANELVAKIKEWEIRSNEYNLLAKDAIHQLEVIIIPEYKDRLVAMLRRLQTYCLKASFIVDPDLNKYIELYLHHFNHIKDKKYVEPCVLDELKKHHEVALEIGHIKEVARETRKKCIKRLDVLLTQLEIDYRSLYSKFTNVKLRSDYVLLEPYKELWEQYLRRLVTSCSPYMQYSTEDQRRTYNSLYESTNDILKELFKFVKNLQEDVENDAKMAMGIFFNIYDILNNYVKIDISVDEVYDNPEGLRSKITNAPFYNTLTVNDSSVNKYYRTALLDVEEMYIIGRYIKFTPEGLQYMYDAVVDKLNTFIDDLSHIRKEEVIR